MSDHFAATALPKESYQTKDALPGLCLKGSHFNYNFMQAVVTAVVT
jgi:hypothetical protein